MLASLKILAVAATVTASAFFAIGYGPRPHDPTELVTIPAGTLGYRVAGEFLHDGVPVNAPLMSVPFNRTLTIMRHQVSAAEYQLCVRDGACKPVASAGADSSLPVVGVSFVDASAYAAWLSHRTGNRYRLPTDAEWAYAAAERFHDDALAEDGDPANPAKRWLQAYESEAAAARAIGSAARPFGSFGANEVGVEDVAGNVWEWTQTCFVRHTSASGSNATLENCGVRVVEGSHRTYLSDFVRNPHGGACSVGAPPSNLGIRLVRDDATLFERLALVLERIASRGL